MSKQDFDEKDAGKRDEKDEKELNKREEKSVEEKWERDPLGALVWASILIWAGVVLLAANLGAFDLITTLVERLPFGAATFPFESTFLPVEAWTVFWLGAAAILLLEAVVRLLIPQYRRPITGTLILSVVFLGLALGRWECTGPLILIAIGVSILLRQFRGKDGKE